MRIYKPTREGKRGASISYKRWYVELRDHQGIVRRLAGFTDWTATDELGRKLVRIVQLRAAGEPPTGELARYVETMPASVREKLATWSVLDARRVAASRPLEDLVQEWRRSIEARERTSKHVEHSIGRARRLFGACGFSRWSDIRPEAVERHLRGLRDRDAAEIALHLAAMEDASEGVRRRQENALSSKGLSAKAAKEYVAAARQFTRWAVSRGLASDDPLRVVEAPDPRLDRRLLRRAISEDELRALLRAAHDAPAWRGVSGPTRALVYALAAETGLRAAEIGALRGASFDVADVERASVALPAAATKNREDAWLPLRAATARALAVHLAGVGPLEHAFVLPRGKEARMLRGDLSRAEIPFMDESERRFDFHALRGMAATRALAFGAGPKVAQRLLRHSTANLTVALYARSRPDEERRAVEALPDILPTERTAARATGTSDRVARCVASEVSSGERKRALEVTPNRTHASENAVATSQSGGGGGNRTRVPGSAITERLRV